MRGLVTPLELGVPYLRRRRAAKPASASRETVAVTGSGTPVEGWFHVEFPLKDFYKSSAAQYQPGGASYGNGEFFEIDWSKVNFFTQFMEAAITMPAGINLMFAIDNLCFKDSTYVAPPAVLPEAKTSGAALMLNDSFNLTYTVSTNDLIASNPLVDVTFDGTTSRVALTEAAEGTYTFPFSGLYAHRLADEITTTVTALDENGKVVKTNHTYSIKDYCTRMLDKAESSDALKTLLSATLRYGAAAQTYAAYNEENLATNGAALIAPPHV
jgi:hypothetical protein